MRYTRKTDHQKPDTKKSKGSNPTSSDPAPTKSLRKRNLQNEIRETSVKKEEEESEETQICTECALELIWSDSSWLDKSFETIIQPPTTSDKTSSQQSAIQKQAKINVFTHAFSKFRGFIKNIIHYIRFYKVGLDKAKFLIAWIQKFKEARLWIEVSILYCQNDETLRVLHATNQLLSIIIKNLESKFGSTTFDDSEDAKSKIVEVLIRRKYMKENNELDESKYLLRSMMNFIEFQMEISRAVENWKMKKPLLESIEKMKETISSAVKILESSEHIISKREEWQEFMDRQIPPGESCQGLASEMNAWLKKWKVDRQDLYSKIFEIEMRPDRVFPIDQLARRSWNFMKRPDKKDLLLLFDIKFVYPKPEIIVNTDSTTTVS